jgi:hypothetical protein
LFALAITVIAIALPDSINPTLIGADLLLVSGKRPRAHTIAFGISVWVVTFVVGLAVALGLGDLILSIVPKPSQAVKYYMMLAFGLVLLIGGPAVFIRRKDLGGDPPSPDEEAESHGSPVLLGGGIAGLEVLTAFPYFAAIALITGSPISGPQKLFLLVLYCVVYTLPLIAISVVCVVKGARAAAALRPTIAWIYLRWPVVVGPLAGLVGAGLIAYALIRLL